MHVLSLIVGLAPLASPDRETLVRDARPIVAAIVEAGRENARRSSPRKGDALTEEYLRVAAGKARGRSPAAFALAVGVALDTSNLMRLNPVVASAWKAVETDSERRTRLGVLGTPTLHGRHDLAQHFGVSMGLTALLGESKAEAAGIVKELLDANEGGSGFSFADLGANFSGIVFTRKLKERPEMLAEIRERFRVADFALPPGGLEEGLSLEAFKNKYGTVRDPRFRKERDELFRRVENLTGYRPKP